MHRLLAQLNRRIVRDGEAVTLRQITGTAPNQVTVNGTIPAIVLPLTAQQLIGSVSIMSFMVIMSPTYLVADGWPHQASPLPPWRFPLTTDKIVLRGQQRQITRAVPIYIKSECVRIELLATG